MRRVKRDWRLKFDELVSTQHSSMISWFGTKRPITITSGINGSRQMYFQLYLNSIWTPKNTGNIWQCSSTSKMMQISGAICSISVKNSTLPKPRYFSAHSSISCQIFERLTLCLIKLFNHIATLDRGKTWPGGWRRDHYDQWFEIASH